MENGPSDSQWSDTAPGSSPSPAPLRQEPENRWKKALMPLGVVGLLLWKLKAFLLVGIKFFPVILKTGGSMFLMIWIYAMNWGWWYAGGFVLLLLVHECGHLIAARRMGLKVGAPVFIPFMGAFIALKEAPRNAWVEAQVGIGGSVLGSLWAQPSAGRSQASRASPCSTPWPTAALC
jgi:Zn-dependent protease